MKDRVDIISAVEGLYDTFPFPPDPLIDEAPPGYNWRWSWPVAYSFCTGQKPEKQDIRILDAGCGTGSSTDYLVHLNPEASVVGIDLSSGAIAGYANDFGDMAAEPFVDLGIAMEPVITDIEEIATITYDEVYGFGEVSIENMEYMGEELIDLGETVYEYEGFDTMGEGFNEFGDVAFEGFEEGVDWVEGAAVDTAHAFEEFPSDFGNFVANDFGDYMASGDYWDFSE